MKNNKDLFFIYLNEFNYKFLSSGAKKFNCKNILRLLKKNKTQTYTEDKIQDKNLDPWVQNISINTGVKSFEHKTFKLGENAPKKYIQIWDLLARNKITSMVWGPMNASYLKNKNLKLFFPDPWNFKNNTYPESLKYLNDLPNYYARNYLDIKIYKIIKYSFLFTLGIFINKSFFFNN